MKKFVWILGSCIVIGGALVAVLLFGPKTDTQVASSQEQEVMTVEQPDTSDALETPDAPAPTTSTPQPVVAEPEPTTPVVQLGAGRYSNYSAAAVATAGYPETILFFHADWCPECRAFEQEIKAGTIPEGVQILEVDYDSNQALRQQYQVTLQTTFVKVNQSGERQSLWVGYGRDKSLAAVLENT